MDVSLGAGGSPGTEVLRSRIFDRQCQQCTIKVGVTGPRASYYTPPPSGVSNKAQNVFLRAVVKGTGNLCCCYPAMGIGQTFKLIRITGVILLQEDNSLGQPQDQNEQTHKK